MRPNIFYQYIFSSMF